MSAIEMMLRVAAAYASLRGLSESRVSTLAFGDGSRLKHLRHGGDMGARRLERALQWFSDHWPLDEPWPESVPRPLRSFAEDAAAPKVDLSDKHEDLVAMHVSQSPFTPSDRPEVK